MQLEGAIPQLPFRVLVIVAHPDDIEFGVAGSVANWTDAGAEVTYCIITDGGAGSNEPGADLAALVETRRQEQIAAAEIVGVKDVRFLGYKDGVLQPTLELRKDLTRLIREIRPQRVVIMDPTTILVQGEGFDYINHPDHRAAGEAALYAVFPSAGTRPIFMDLLEAGYEPHNVDELYMTIAGKANLAVDVTDQFERKIKSLLMHKSQLGEDVRQMIEMWDMETGKEVGVKYAESFRVMRFNQSPALPANAADGSESSGSIEADAALENQPTHEPVSSS